MQQSRRNRLPYGDGEQHWQWHSKNEEEGQIASRASEQLQRWIDNLTAKYGDIEVERELAKRRNVGKCVTEAAKEYLKEIQDDW